MAEEEESQIPESADDEGGEEGLSAPDLVEGGRKAHISALEAVIALMLCAGVDWMELNLSFTGISLLLSSVDLGLYALFIILFALKGGGYSSAVKKAVFKITGGTIAELIPLLEMLPIRTIVMAWTILSWNKEVATQREEKTGKRPDWENKTAEAVEKYLGRFG